jgi:hypothetical protein
MAGESIQRYYMIARLAIAEAKMTFYGVFLGNNAIVDSFTVFLNFRYLL